MKSKSLIESLLFCSVLLFSTVSCSKDSSKDDSKNGAGANSERILKVETLDVDPSDVTIISASVSFKINMIGVSIDALSEIGVAYSSRNKTVTVNDPTKAIKFNSDTLITKGDTIFNKQGSYYVNNGNEITVCMKLDNINIATTYYYMGYAKHSGGVVRGGVKQFTTKDTKGVAVAGAYDPETHVATATLNCKGFENQVTEIGICYSSKSNPNVNSDFKVFTTSYPKDGKLSIELNNIPFDKFYFRPYVKLGEYNKIDGDVQTGQGNSILSTSEFDEDTYSLTTNLAFTTGYTNLKMGVCYSKTNPNPTIQDRFAYAAVIDSVNNSFTASIVAVPFGKIYCRTFVQLGDQTCYGKEVRTFFRKMPIGEPVDLGLSVLWANMNLGADCPEGNGLYYAFADTTDKDRYTLNTTRYFVGTNESATTSDNYYIFSKYQRTGTYADGKVTLDPEDDAATFNWGGDWRTPSYQEMSELINECEMSFEVVNGNYCFRFTGPNGNSILMPTSGYSYDDYFYDMSTMSENSCGAYYQTRSLHTYQYSCWAFYMYHSTRNYYYDDNDNYHELDTPILEFGAEMVSDMRYYGRTVRPVCPK